MVIRNPGLSIPRAVPDGVAKAGKNTYCKKKMDVCI